MSLALPGQAAAGSRTPTSGRPSDIGRSEGAWGKSAPSDAGHQAKRWAVPSYGARRNGIAREGQDDGRVSWSTKAAATAQGGLRDMAAPAASPRLAEVVANGRPFWGGAQLAVNVGLSCRLPPPC